MDDLGIAEPLDAVSVHDLAPWNGIEQESLKAILTSAEVVRAARGEEIRAEVAILFYGALGVERSLFNGRRVLVSLFHGGDLVDLRRDERPRQGRLVALSDSLLLTLDAEALDRAVDKDPKLGKTLLHHAADQSGRTRDHVADLAAKTPLERLASVLFEFRRWPDVLAMDPGGESLLMPILRKDIADYLGIKPETISRALKRLQSAGMIATAREEANRILFLDIPSMRRLANGAHPKERAGAVGLE